MFEPPDFHRAEEVRNLFKFHIIQLLCFLPKLDMSIDLYICSSD